MVTCECGFHKLWSYYHFVNMECCYGGYTIFSVQEDAILILHSAESVFWGLWPEMRSYHTHLNALRFICLTHLEQATWQYILGFSV